MSVQLEEYAEELGSLSEHSRDILQASWQEATRVFSQQGLDIYLGGALSLKNLGRGHELVSTFIQNAPGIARTLGEGVIDSLIENAMMMASKTSGTVIELVLATAPTAADRLADAELFKKYLQLLNNLVATAPRGIRPMLENLDTLFAHLTLGGLRRWSNWGAQVHRTNYEEQIRYFSLASKESQAMLQQERKGTLFVDVQRRINMYLRALWARDFFMRPTSGDFEKREGYRPYIEDYLLHLPDAYDDIVIEGQEPISGLTLYRAAAAHSAAHVVYTQEPISAENLNNLQMAVISVFEDARIEALAIQDFPGLRPIWAQFHTIPATQANTMGDYLNRMARALLDPNFEDDHPLIARARELFAAEQHRLRDNQLSWDCGAVLAHELMSLRIPFQQRTDVLTAPYRDDNRYFWAFEEFDFDKSLEAGYDNVQSVRKQVSVMEMINEIDSELTDGNPQEVWVLGTELFPYEDHGVSWNEMEGNPPVSAPFHYPEWDYQIQHERPSWATVLEKRAKLGELSLIDDIAARYKREISRMKFLLDAMQPQGVQRIRKLEDGDEVDINAAIRAMVDIRQGRQPDPRIMMRSVRKTRDISVMVLLDLSESTNEKVTGQEFSVLDLTRQACVLLADAIAKIGDPFAIHGFCSDGRHDVEYYRFKDFDETYNELPKAKLAGMTGQLSTRMGAAIRHASHHLKQQRSTKKLMLVITDGEPADIDVRDPQYLRHDTKKAVEEATRNGIITYCMSLDPRADQYVSRIFGARNFMVVDHVERLPEKLPMLYAGLTR
ncbi:MAG: VWA domain-containing protein [Halothiobacillus sp. 20-53-49]|nr:nitric oxide reductase activation protein NorD [Halothiobacillaceae bacterium]OYV46762.1 MAG: VWA domain-containing protein [Halothiobacillus sp. 20-53-49]HUN00293.1 nitric oxide reductase activation protein NorD [Halothiobacillus sp.]